MNAFIRFPILIATAILAGCGTTADIKPVTNKQVQDLKASATSKPIQLSKVVVKLKRGEHVGAVQGGLLCIPQGDLTWKGGRLKIDSDEFTDAFKEELEKYNFKTVGDTNALFEDPSTWKSEVLVAGLIKELKVNACYPFSGYGNLTSSKGEAFIKVEWQIYSKLDRSVVHSVTTEGSSINEETVAGGDTTAVLNAFSQASQNLLADAKFREIVSKGGETVRTTSIKSGSSVIITNEKSKPVGYNTKDWVKAVVTIFAGNGHGSGFVISDNLILTNHHVVGESDTVSVKFDSGLEVTGKVAAYNSSRDVALVKVDGTLPFHFSFSNQPPSIGEDVYAIGSPLDEKLSSTVSKGIVSGYREENLKKFIQSDVNIRPGNSGGPLLNKSGEAVGIAVSGLNIGNTPQGINFFIPIYDALNSLGIN